jgi:hypothetical protein
MGEIRGGAVVSVDLQDFWKAYRDEVYPEGAGGVQSREAHQAFFAGAFAVSLRLLSESDPLETGRQVQKQAAEFVAPGRLGKFR